jgi:hypothetical protein
MNDPIVDEVRRVRDAHAAMFDYELDVSFRDIKKEEQKNDLKFVSYPSRRIEPTQTLQPTEGALPVSQDENPPETVPAAEAEAFGG